MARWSALAALLVMSACETAEGAFVKVVPDRALVEALGSEIPRHRTMTDDVAHFEARLLERPNDMLSRRRLISSYLLRFRAYGDTADLAAATGHLAALERNEVPDPGVLATTASMHLTRHDFAAARQAAAAALHVSHNFDPALELRLFDALWASGEYEDALATLELPHDSTSTDYLSREARILDRRGDIAGARDNMRLVLRKVREFAEPAAVEAWALVELGKFEHHSGDPLRAAGLYEEALRVLPGSPAALEALASLAYGVDRNLDAASQLYRRAVDHGGHLDILATLAEVEEERGNADEAAAVREEFVQRATGADLMLRWSLRPLALMLAPDPVTACQALEFARRDLEDRSDSGTWDAFAWTLYWTGDLRGAYDASVRATEWGVPEPRVAYRAAVIARAYGDTDRATDLLRAALVAHTELSPSVEADARRRLDGFRPATAPGQLTCGSVESRTAATSTRAVGGSGLSKRST